MSLRLGSAALGAQEGRINSVRIKEVRTITERIRNAGFRFVELDDDADGEEERHFSANIERLVNLLEEHYDADASLQRSALKQLFLQRKELIEEFNDVGERLDELFFLQ